MLGLHRADRKTDDVVFLSAHGGDRIDRLRVGAGPENEYLEIQHPSLGMCLFVQPDKLCEFAASKALLGSGMIARLNIVQPNSRVGSRLETGQETPVPMDLISAWKRAIYRVIDWRFGIVDRDGPLSPIVLRLSPAAMEARRSFFNEIETRQGPGGDLSACSEWASKMAGEVARLAALFHLFKCGRDGVDPETNPEILGEHPKAASEEHLKTGQS